MSSSRRLVLLTALVLFPALLVMAQDPERPRRGGGRRGRGGGGEAARDGAGDSKDDIKSYDEVITADMKSDGGLFMVHTKDGKVFFEIPTAQLGKDMLWVTRIKETQAGFGYGGTGAGDRVVRWELKDDKVLLRDIKYRIRADVDDPIKNAVHATSLAPIIQVFDVECWGKDRAPVIEVTDLYTSDVREFSASRSLGASGADSRRSWVEGMKSFPDNVEADVLMTYRLSAGGGGGDGGDSPRRRRGGGERRDPSQSAVSVLVHHSMVKLPEKPMMPREFDPRIGFFTVGFEDYGGEDHQVDRKRYITRWRLEKKEPEAEVSEPVKPIVFYVGPGVPARWREWVKKGIESWQPAFEAAGFKNAIIAKDAPDPREDPDWDAEDARYSSIRWLPSTTENAMGPHVSDPRTGEILEADIIVYHNILKLVRDWYFTQASPSDERAQQLPMPDELIGELLAYVIAHEVGHSLGFPHNMMASSGYSVEQLRDPEFTKKNGTEASIMDYGRFNYVAQPEDHASLIPVIGPYDYFAVEWGYRQFPGVRTPADAKPHLAKIQARQLDNPMLLFGDADPSEDPSRQTEDLGSDPIAATELGLKNIDRVAGYLVDACCKEGEDYSLLQNMYDSLMSQRGKELAHVTGVVGGVNRKNFWFGQADAVYEPVSAVRQRLAVAFLGKHCFRTPTGMIRPDILTRLEANGATDRVLREQQRILTSLISDGRVKRMAELATHAEGEAYLPQVMLEDVRQEIWSETLRGGAIDVYRRNLQRAHVDHLVKEMERESTDSDLPALARGELECIRELVRNESGREITEVLHLRDIGARIDKALNPSRIDPTIDIAPASSRTNL